MKTIISDELRARLTNAAANGSTIARNILAEVKSGKKATEVLKGTTNYFSTKRKKSSRESIQTMRVVFTACTKDISNPNFPDRNNPQAPWFPENRTELEPSTFIECFKNLPEYTQNDLKFFISAIIVDSKITIKLHDKMADFIEAYSAENYIPAAQQGETSLHNSCMRYEQTARNAADFYYNFAGAKIIVARDSSNHILGRAIVWENAICKHNKKEYTISVLDRVYFSHSFIITMIYNYAESIGLKLRKRYNDYQHPMDFVALNPIEKIGVAKGLALDGLTLKINVPASKWHKKGAPYMDTFYCLYLKNKSILELSNATHRECMASLRQINGYADRERYFCPCCGEQHDGDYDHICTMCRQVLFTQTEFGMTMNSRAVTYRDKVYPSILFKKGRPTQFMRLHLQIERLFNA